jgi:hypothetical protein
MKKLSLMTMITVLIMTGSSSIFAQQLRTGNLVSVSYLKNFQKDYAYKRLNSSQKIGYTAIRWSSSIFRLVIGFAANYPGAGSDSNVQNAVAGTAFNAIINGSTEVVEDAFLQFWTGYSLKTSAPVIFKKKLMYIEPQDLGVEFVIDIEKPIFNDDYALWTMPGILGTHLVNEAYDHSYDYVYRHVADKVTSLAGVKTISERALDFNGINGAAPIVLLYNEFQRLTSNDGSLTDIYGRMTGINAATEMFSRSVPGAVMALKNNNALQRAAVILAAHYVSDAWRSGRSGRAGRAGIPCLFS